MENTTVSWVKSESTYQWIILFNSHGPCRSIGWLIIPEFWSYKPFCLHGMPCDIYKLKCTFSSKLNESKYGHIAQNSTLGAKIIVQIGLMLGHLNVSRTTHQKTLIIFLKINPQILKYVVFNYIYFINVQNVCQYWVFSLILRLLVNNVPVLYDRQWWAIFKFLIGANDWKYIQLFC